MARGILGGLIVVFQSSGDPPVVPTTYSYYKTRSGPLSTAVPFDLEFWRTDFAFLKSLGAFQHVPLVPDHAAKEFIFQQVIHARIFPRAASNLSAMAFRPNLDARPASQVPGRPPGYTRTIEDVRITLGTASRNPADLGPEPANNLGPGASMVFQGPLTLSSRPTGRRQIPAYDIRINFAKPFAYDPAAGNLLLQIAVPLGTAAAGFLPPLDAVFQDGTVACRLWTPKG
jgi:hypothetical protein